MRKKIFDLESDGLLNEATKIHCISWGYEDKNDVHSITSHPEMVEFFQQEDVILVGHKIKTFDIPLAEKILNVKVKCPIIDTLPFSWYLEPERKIHGLESYGIEFGVEKPKIDSWERGEGESEEEFLARMCNRCQEDVKINRILWRNQYRYLINLYDGDEELLQRFINYINFKMDCVREQEEEGVKIDILHCESMLSRFEGEKEEKQSQLTEAMPKVAIKVTRNLPKIMYKKDGSLSANGEKWFKLLENEGLPSETTTDVEVVTGWEEGNPNSHEQIKKWLYSLGWVPENIKHVRNKKTGEVKRIPQVASKEGQGEVCESVVKLFGIEPKLELLAGLSVLSHRISIFKGFLEAGGEEGILYPTVTGLTNTLRMQHSVIVNLPGLDKKYGKEIRSSIIAKEGHILCGTDLAGIEDRTKRHFIYKYDPEYVKEMESEDYDPHLTIAVLAGLLTEEQSHEHKLYSKTNGKEGVNHFAERQKGKIGNYSAIYKVGAETLARSLNSSILVAKRVLRAYWDKNKAVLDVENECVVKEIGWSKWLQNPINGFWYSLRSEKDRFSTLNQGTGAYIFDIWLSYIRREGVRVAFQYHDEAMINIILGNEQYITDVINNAMEKVNNKLKLNTLLGCTVKFGKHYAEIH